MARLRAFECGFNATIKINARIFLYNSKSSFRMARMENEMHPIKKRRKMKLLTLADIDLHSTGLSSSLLSSIESGDRRATDATLLNLAPFLQISLALLTKEVKMWEADHYKGYREQQKEPVEANLNLS